MNYETTNVVVQQIVKFLLKYNGMEFQIPMYILSAMLEFQRLGNNVAAIKLLRAFSSDEQYDIEPLGLKEAKDVNDTLIEMSKNGRLAEFDIH